MLAQGRDNILPAVCAARRGLEIACVGCYARQLVAACVADRRAAAVPIWNMPLNHSQASLI